MTLDTFIDCDGLRNQWISERNISVYVRKSVRMIEGDLVACLDIGSVEVDEEHRGVGIFTGFLQRMEDYGKKLNRTIFVESILEPRLLRFLLQRGYQLDRAWRIEPTLPAPCVFRKMS